MGNGLRLGVEPLPEPPPRHDTLVVAGGPGARRSIEDGPILDWIARASARARRTTSVCTGSYLLAAAGLLDGRRATTYWEYCDALAARFPAIRLEPDPVFVRDEDLSVAALAARAHLSERSFARALRAEVGKTPAVYAEMLRVERARALLEDGAESTSALPRTASASGSPPERFEPAVPTP